MSTLLLFEDLVNNMRLVGTLPPGFSDPLGPAGLQAFEEGLKVTTCSPTPSLGMTSTTPPQTIPTGSTTTITTTTSTSVTTTTTTTSRSTTTSSESTTTSTSTTTTTSTGPQPTVCTAGYGLNNYIGLCSFCCSYGYCPSGPCTCTAWGTAASTPPPEATPPVQGVPLPGEDNSYLGLCNYACAHGYCPPTACTAAN
jgi:hypothetical protein